MEYIIVFWVIFAILSAVLANRFNRDPVGWFFIGLPGSLAGFALLLCLGPHSAKQKAAMIAADKRQIEIADQQRRMKTPAQRRMNFLFVIALLAIVIAVALRPNYYYHYEAPLDIHFNHEMEKPQAPLPVIGPAGLGKPKVKASVSPRATETRGFEAVTRY